MPEVIIAGRNIIEYLRLKKAGYVTVWSGEGKICMKKPCERFVAADSEWHYLTDSEGNEFSFSSYDKAKEKIPLISIETDLPETDILILYELRKAMP